ncbi:MAG: hypothetical protein LAT68_14745 [Cyclobacteriaceae bacterium]|nr:hypothetical protein [Cyclobacteriaceae bacterium]
MSRQLTASDRNQLIHLASELPKGSRERKAILAGLQKVSDREFDYENGEIGVSVDGRGYDHYINIFYPLGNIGRRGKTVTHVQARIMGAGSVAWGHEFLHRIKGKNRASQALKLLDQETKAAKAADDNAYVHVSESKIKGIDNSLPTPKSQKIEDIKGRHIQVDMNSKPIRVYDPSYAKELEKSFQRYRFDIPHRYRFKVHSLRDEIATARSHTDVKKILTKNGIRFDFRTFMDSMYD